MVVVSDEAYDVQKWLLEEGKDLGTLAALLKAYISRVQDHNIPIDRMLIATYLIHTQLGAWHFKYEAPDTYYQKPLEREFLMKIREMAGIDAPFRQMELGATRVRIRGTDENIPNDVRSLFTERGFTDMYALPVSYRGKFTCGLSWATKEPEGFSDDHIAFFDATHPALGTVVQFLVHELVKYSLLCTYLGKDPGSRVHKGSVYRGDTVTVRSVIWFSDVRGFTPLSQELDREGIIVLINEVFEITERVLKKHGGEILKFLGDGLLAVFTIPDMDRRSSIFEKGGESQRIQFPSDLDDSQSSSSEDSEWVSEETQLCGMARKAAYEFQQQLAELRMKRSKLGLPGPDVGVGLHWGDASYGNVGGPTRLDFTVIGPSVNLASRVEGLCSKLSAKVLASEAFVVRDDSGFWQCLGKHVVKGHTEPVSVYELSEVGSSPAKGCPSQVLEDAMGVKRSSNSNENLPASHEAEGP